MIKNKIIAILLCVFTCISNFSVSAEETTVTPDMQYAEKLNAFGLIEMPNQETMTAKITKLDFSVLVSEVFGLNDELTTEDYVDGAVFNDANRFIEEYPSIYNLYKRGILVGEPGGNFNPDQIVDVNFAATVTVRALGYEKLAEFDGGYPNGYLKIASELKLLKGVKNNSELTHSDAYRILANAVENNIYKLTIGEDGFEFAQGKSVIESIYDIYTVEGVMDRNEYSCLISPLDSMRNIVSINSVELVNNNPNINKYLGVKLKAYYKEINGVEYLLYAEPLDKRYSEITFDGKDFERIELNNIYFNNENKTQRISLSETKDVLYNEVALIGYGDLTGYLNGADEIILRDNEGDGKYDVISITKYSHGIVNFISTENKNIWFKGGQNKQFSDDDIIKIYTDDGELSFNDLKNGDIISYSESINTSGVKVYIVYANGLKITGKINKLSEEKVDIEGTEYNIVPNLRTSINVGKQYTVYIGRGNMVFYCENAPGTKMYGIMMRSWFDDSEFVYGAKIYTSSNEFKSFSFDESFRVDGLKYKYNGSKENEIDVMLGNINRDTFVSYTLNKEGKIKELYTPSTQVGKPLQIVGTISSGYAFANYNFDKKFVYSDNTTIFRIPDASNSGDESKYSTLSKPVRGGTSVTAYSMTPNEIPLAEALVIKSSAASLSDISNIYNNKWAVVKNVTDIVDSNDEIVKAVEVFNGNEQILTFESDEILNTVPLSKGDIFVYVTDSVTGKITDYSLVYSERTGSQPYIKLGNNEMRGFASTAGWNIVYGDVQYLDGTYMLFDTYYQNAKETYVDTIDNPNVIIYDKKRNTARTGNKSEITIGDKIVFWESSNNIRDLFIIRQ